MLTCSRRSDLNGTPAKNIASERAAVRKRGENEGWKTSTSLSLLFPALSLALHYLNARNRLISCSICSKDCLAYMYTRGTLVKLRGGARNFFGLLT